MGTAHDDAIRMLRDELLAVAIACVPGNVTASTQRRLLADAGRRIGAAARRARDGACGDCARAVLAAALATPPAGADDASIEQWRTAIHAGLAALDDDP